MLTDEQLVARAKDGDDLAFAALAHRYQRLTQHYARKRYGPGLQQQDLDQEAVIGLWVAVRSFDPADELGAQFHADAGKHHPDSRCEWCTSAGKSVLESKAVGPLLVRRRASGRYEPRDGSGTAVVPDRYQQTGELPGESFADIFGDAA